jgi:DNA mismatch endonuclease, patch repair protein
MPTTHQDYWIPKFKRTIERDKRNQEELRRLGWHVIVLWECEIKDLDLLSERLMNSVTSSKRQYSQEY